LEHYGNSTSDYFKLHKDKLLFFSSIHEAFIAYRIAGGFAIVLEEPVCAPENKLSVIREFEWHCRKMGLKTAFYRVDESSITYFNELRKRKLMIGQEAILELDLFSLEGKENKSLRNALNSLSKKGYTTEIHHPPYTNEFMSELKKVSDEWLKYYHKSEIIFSQGMFDSKELQQQDIIAIHDAEGHIKAFLNIIPDYSPDECTYDLIRKTADAPGGSIDALIIKLVEYAKNMGLHFINMGMVAMQTESVPENTAEQLMKMAVKKIRLFRHYQGLRDFKSKYATIWENKYLVYENDFDLLLLPAALHKVMQP
jgi:phosphatidylglycerol lysyltransferase